RYLAEDRSSSVKRLLLLTDGEASMGDRTSAGLAKIAENLATKHEVSTSCLGFGLEYDEDTLKVIASAGAGRLHHVSGGDLAAIYAAELDRLRDLVAPWIRVKVTPAPGARVHGSRNAY